MIDFLALVAIWVSGVVCGVAAAVYVYHRYRDSAIIRALQGLP